MFGLTGAPKPDQAAQADQPDRFDALAGRTTPTADIKLVALLQEAFRHCKIRAGGGRRRNPISGRVTRPSSWPVNTVSSSPDNTSNARPRTRATLRCRCPHRPTDGFYVDVTRSIDEDQTTITEAVAEIAKHRSTIEQAKGVLMVVYGIDADAAFDILKWRSQESNIKLRVLAERLMSQFQSLRYGEAPPARSTFDQILMTVPQRVTNA